MAVEFFAGYVGGCAGVLVGHPFDTVKIRLQTQSFSAPLYRGTFDCFASVVKQESVLGLFKGMSSPLYGIALINAVVFSVKSSVHRRLSNPDSMWCHFSAGAIAGVAQSFICSPMELVKTRMQMQGQGESRRRFAQVRHAYTDPVDCLRKLYTTEGVRGVFRGLMPTACRDAPAFGVYFCTYECLCKQLSGRDCDGGVVLGTPALLLSGGMAGICAWLCTYPIDVVKSRYQADAHRQYSGFLHCCRTSYREMGRAVFTRGLSATLLRAFPVNAATMTIVTLILSNFRRGGLDDDDITDLSVYARQRYHPHSTMYLTFLTNFPSHP